MSDIKQVQYRQLGSSGLRVSVPILGAMSFGSTEWQSWVLDEDKSIEILKAAWDRGINTFDTANMYSNGESERIIGKFIEKYNIPRNQLVILTKCFFHVAPKPSEHTPLKMAELNQQRQYVNQGGLSRAAIFNQVEASLQRLNTTYIDLLQIHRRDPETPAEETMKALHDLVQSGKVRYIGASAMKAWQFAHMNEVAARNGWTKFVSMQDEYSLLYREEEREMHAYCRFHGIGIIPYGPLNGGHLARPLGTSTVRDESAKGTPWAFNPTDADRAILSRVEELAQKHGVTMAKIALAWIDLKVSSPIVGTSSVKRIEDNIPDPNLKLSDEEVKYLEELYVPKAIRGLLSE
ncbi:aldo keto reductase [Moniliophthora roreri MCA 2997]|uniref:Aldo keto reductase n=2 Tax=Moniliophthora roreri TaxID=221103 RepID=V2XRU1_MONRO|nr:aldo keto reductase [Moniliophthora roreri MCA 2997]KAI3616258.1 aldo keto reductase [Moniliophthora roreri]